MLAKKMVMILLGCTVGITPMALRADDDAMQPKDCSSMSEEVQQFAGQLTPLNRQLFCGQFTDAQRASAIQLTQTPDATGLTMSPDMAVQKVTTGNGSNPQQKTPTGCPVK